MCGRYVPSNNASIEREFNLVRTEWQSPPSYNVAPTQDVPIVRVNAEGERTGTRVHWGLIPFGVFSAGRAVRAVPALARHGDSEA